MHTMHTFGQKMPLLEGPVLPLIGGLIGGLVGGGGTLAGILTAEGLMGAGVGLASAMVVGKLFDTKTPKVSGLQEVTSTAQQQTPAAPATPEAPVVPVPPAATPVTPEPVTTPTQPVAQPTPTPETVATPNAATQDTGAAPLTAAEIAQGMAETRKRRGRISTILTKPSDRGIPDSGDDTVERLGG